MLIPRAGQCIGDFELIRRIGAGGMGVVYEARQLTTGRQVALKILSPALSREKNRLRFLREAEAAARLHHPNIVAVYAIREDAELCYYAMEYIQGWPLSRVIEQLAAVSRSGSQEFSQVSLAEFMYTHADQNAGCDSTAATVIEGPATSAGGRSAGPADSAARSDDSSKTLSRLSFAPAGEAGRKASRLTEDRRDASDTASGQDVGDGGDADSTGSMHSAGISGWPSAIRKPQGAVSPRSLIGDESYVRQVVTMIRDIAQALQYAHSQGVTHRDIKPDNLLMDQEGKLHLVDFGLARVLEEDNLTLTGELMGTPLYMSPEQVAAGRIGIDHRTDLYSLGVVLYHLLCLQPPYEAPTREALLRAIVIHSPPPLSSRNPAVSRELETIVHHAMEKDPDRRYASGAELADDLDRWLAGKPISLRPPSRLRQWWNGLSGSRRKAWAGAAGTALAALATAIFLTAGPRDRGKIAVAPPSPGEAVQRAAQEAAAGDYFHSALWYAEAFRRGAGPKEVSNLQASIIFNELAVPYGRFPLSAARRSWGLHPAQALCAFAEAGGGMRVWDLLAGPAATSAFGPEASPQWLTFDDSGRVLWSIQAGDDGDLLQLWTPTGEPLTAEPVKVAGRITGVRIAEGGRTAGADAYTVMVLVSPSPPAAGQPGGRRLQNVAVYRIQPGHPGKLLRQMSGVRRADLSHDGRWLAALSADDVFQTVLLTSASSIPLGPAGTTALFAFSPTAEDMALADPKGEISFREPRPGEPARQVGVALEISGLRPGVTPAYLRFSSDGKHLLVVGTDTEVIPPHRRSVAILSTQSATELHRAFARDACFSADGRTVAWWDDEGVTLAICEENQVKPRPPIRVPVLKRPVAPAGGMGGAFSDTRPLPVQLDARGQRMVCIESMGRNQPDVQSGRVSVWDVHTGERLRILRVPANVNACGLDATGRFALVQLDQPRPTLLAWDLGSPEAPYLRSAPISAVPVSLSDLRLTPSPLLVMRSQTDDGPQWLVLDPATRRSVYPPVPAERSDSTWLTSEDATLLLQVIGDGIRTLDTRSGRWGPLITFTESPESVLALSPDKRTVATSHDFRLILHRVDTGTVELELPALSYRPVRARFSPSGRYLAVAGQGRITVYSLDPAGRTMEVDTGQPVEQMVFCFEETLLAVGHTAGAASLWSVPEGRCVGKVEPAAGPQLPTFIAVRDQPVGSAPPLLATACANRIELRALPPSPAGGAEVRLDPIGPPLETMDGIVALAFPPCQTDPAMPDGKAGASPSAQTRPSNENESRPCERLLVLTDNPAVCWFDLAAHAWTPEQWRRQIAARTGMMIDAEGKPAPAH
ncbi:MAG TPA: WD40 repeat domain-containing serine/threonine protein kinase [Phycisphaerae bacterium]|nr:WD40 repeat domain-containing serine/threonine protein kinase [Phycisphaerae bacterium]HQA46082.1 WD40 repeat domain-containing serine/threonine protein kinase [Phycisphaerae bacterium]HQE41603.1 WD40 repeat domain-containing serine/threonine protein kinase [Phycisphaerae bacterium]